MLTTMIAVLSNVSKWSTGRGVARSGAAMTGELEKVVTPELRFAGRIVSRSGGRGERDRKGRPETGLALDGDVAALLGHKSFSYVEAEAEAGAVRARLLLLC